MSSFKKNRTIPNITEKGNNLINQAENAKLVKLTEKSIKGVTVPFTEEMTNLLEMIFIHFEGNISKRKLCAKYLLKSLKLEAVELNLIKSN